MRGLSLFAPLLLLTALLAGCAQQEPGAESTTADPGVDVEATETTGVIKGVVVDLAVIPLAKAVVTVKAAGKTLTNTTNSVGGFGFEGLEPGTYFVSASKAGYKSGQISVEVVAGDSNPPTSRITLESDGTFTKPYSEVTKFDGFIACGVTTAVITAAVCSIVNDAYPLFDDRFITIVPVGANPSFAQHELIWQDNQPVPQQFQLVLRAVEKGGSGFSDMPGDIIGVSPVIASINEETLDEYEVGNTTDLYPTVFAGGIPGSNVCAVICWFGTGVTFEQRFELYTTVTYGFLPKEGYAFTAGDAKPVPPA